jgi:Ca2+-binding EF-hand superfamily protein
MDRDSRHSRRKTSMNSKMLVSALAVVAILGTALAASAEGRGEHRMGRGHGGPDGFGAGMEMMFDGADTDADGKITAEEFEAATKARVDAADADKNGMLSADEMVAAAEARREAMRKAHAAKLMDGFIDRRDTNDDGQLSYDEMTPGDAGGRFFDRFDKDGDGTVSQDEIAQAMKDHGGRRHGHERGEQRRGN